MNCLHVTALVAFVLVLSLITMTSQAQQWKGTITLTADMWCPYNCSPTSDKPGYMVELAKEIFEPAGYRVQYTLMSWDDAINEVEHGRIDGLIGTTRDETPSFHFPEIKQGLTEFSFFVKTGVHWSYQGKESLQKVRLGAIADYGYSDIVDDYIAEHAGNKKRVQLVSGETALAELVEDLLRRRISAVAEDRYVMGHHLWEIGKTGSLTKAGRLNASVIPDEDYLYIGFSPKGKQSAEFAAILSEGTQRLRKSGRLTELLNRYGLKDWELSIF